MIINCEHNRGNLGYWIGKKFWNRGYCSEAGIGIIEYGFEELNLNRICASHFKKNPSSGRVMQKLGMKKEGVLRQHIKKWGQYNDFVYYGILKEEYDSE